MCTVPAIQRERRKKKEGSLAPKNAATWPSANQTVYTSDIGPSDSDFFFLSLCRLQTFSIPRSRVEDLGLMAIILKKSTFNLLFGLFKFVTFPFGLYEAPVSFHPSMGQGVKTFFKEIFKLHSSTPLKPVTLHDATADHTI